MHVKVNTFLDPYFGLNAFELNYKVKIRVLSYHRACASLRQLLQIDKVLK